jgi:hypothetical protein
MTDLKEASKEGGNSISLSPQRTTSIAAVVVDMKKKTPALKKSKNNIPNIKANIKHKLDDVNVDLAPSYSKKTMPKK